MPLKPHTLGFFCGANTAFMKYFLISLTILLLAISHTNSAFAEEKYSGSSANLIATNISVKEDKRVQILTDFLASKNSPLTDSAATFIEEADKNNIDWKLVAAISGVESTFGKAIPLNSYNAWGWGIYGDHMTRFASFDEGITIISKGLRENYINRLGTDNVYAIGKMYAASPTWAIRVEFFMNAIEKFASSEPNYNLSLSI
jgi:hypothetical protein